MLPLTHLLLLLCTKAASGFYPNHESGDVAATDFTDADITEKGVIKAVTWFMERYPLPGKPLMKKGSLANKTPTELFKAYFEADVSPSRFMSALKEIIDGNNQVEIHHAEDSSFFFHCEEIAKSIKQLRALRDSMFSSLRKKEPDLEAARLSAGKAIHVLQKFYSNTNWVEMGETLPYKYLINEDEDTVPVAKRSEGTCRNCKKDINDIYSCKDNLLVTDKLTSGYKTSATCREKLQGKCGHGGKDDENQDRPPTGGINKATSNPLLSPHFHLHKQAAELAIQATMDFFVGDDGSLLRELGDKIFKAFFNMEGYSLTFVIDTTSSMEDDIAEVRATCMKILQNYSTSPDKPINYILVPFNDPEVGPVMKTDNVHTFATYIDGLIVAGGGDCPEMSLTGQKLALEESLPRSKIFGFTDDLPKDEHLENEIKRISDTKRSSISFVVSKASCEDRKRRSITARTYTDIYEEIAVYSGGYYVKTEKYELSKVLGIVELFLNAAPVKVAFHRMNGARFSFPVDETLTEISVSVKSIHSARDFSMTVLQPSGAPVQSTHTIINTDKHKVVKVSPINKHGLWTVVVSPRGSYTVEIGGKSLLDFTYQIMKKQKGYVLPIQGRPVKGTTYIVSLRLLEHTKGAQFQRLVSISDQGIPFTSVALNQTSDALGNAFAVASFSVDATSFLLSVEGQSPEGLPFSRLIPNPIYMESVHIELMPDQNFTILSGQTQEISVYVMNSGTGASFTFSASDNLNFVKNFNPPQKYINSGEKAILTASLTVPAESSNITTSIVTFSAESFRSHNYLQVPVTVVPESALEVDQVPPVYKLLQFTMPCTANSQSSPDCSHHIWRMAFSVKDDRSAVTARVNSNPSGLACYPAEDDDGGKDINCDYNDDDVCTNKAQFDDPPE
ncbi:von Willebrand factor A domain-containing protein 7-like [Varanus komodoensis]|uniref:von Willebrand factor A domain-containing protein 7-like n=1 Tax=Varanus komodoensis TaxID=61221 RepID=UPI001CF79D72|nr:von Willebrand factor A domain-containing protein 7-like [Varanus komodoensis]